MKKFFGILLLGVMVMLMPITAHAAGQLKLQKVGDCVETGDNCTYTYKLSVEGDSDTYTSLSVAFTYAPKGGKANGITNMTFTAPEGWTANAVQNDNGYNVTYSYNEGLFTGSSFDLGTVTVTTLRDADIYDCSFNYAFNGKTSTVEVEVVQTVETGASLPIAIIACGAIAAVVVYKQATKNTKMYKI